MTHSSKLRLRIALARIRHYAKRLWRLESPRPVEFVGGGMSFLWGVALLTDDVFSIGNLYAHLGRVMSQHAWGLSMLAMGVMQLAYASVIDRGGNTPSRIYHYVLNFTGFSCWLFITFVAVLAVPVSTAVGYASIAFAYFWALSRSAGQIR